MKANVDQNQRVSRVHTRAPAMVESGQVPVSQGPAYVAAQRRPSEAGGAPARGYPALVSAYDPSGASVVLAATRALLTATSRTDVVRVLHTAVEDLGGTVVPARSAAQGAIPVDVSLGVGEPQVVVVDAVHPASLGLTSHLPTLVEDALTWAARCEGDRRRPMRVTLDPHLGLDSRAVAPRLGEAVAGDVVCRVELDDLALLTESHGAVAAELALERCAALLRTHVRIPGDFVSRCEGDDLVVILAGAPLDVACDRMRQVALAWMAEHQASLSIGVAVCAENGGVAAQVAAESALRRARELGRNRLAVATNEDHASAPI